MKKLAINGGNKVRIKPFPKDITVGEEEKKAIIDVIDNGTLSGFLGSWHPKFYGGTQVQALEKEWCDYYNVKNSIAVNSATSGLYCAVGATGAGPGDEIIVSPYTMSASATAPLIYNAIPVFADIEEDYFCLCPESIEEKITERTKAIIVVDIFGQPYDAQRINNIAKKNNLFVIEDAAQAPGSKYGDQYAGTLGDIGVFSLNCHKHIQTGEGGIIVTNNDELADRLRLIRNHAEAVLVNKPFTTLVNMVGNNLRMTEMAAAVAREQLKKLEKFVMKRLQNLDYLLKGIKDIPCIEPAKVRANCRNDFYGHPMKFKEEIAGVSREKFVKALSAELSLELEENLLMGVSAGYVKPLYLQPIFQKLIAYGELGCPFKCPFYKGELNYDMGLCPTCEKMHFKELISHSFMQPALNKDDLDDVIKAFKKVWENIEELK